jgi:hypothetical protein
MLTALVLLCSIGTTDCRNIAEAPDQTELPFMCIERRFPTRFIDWLSSDFWAS